MKLLKKVGVTIIGVLVSLKLYAQKVYAQTTIDPMSVCDYGVIEPSRQTSPSMARIFSTIIIPIVLIIGLIVYFVKSKSEIWKKILITIGIIAVYIAFAIIINNI